MPPRVQGPTSLEDAREVDPTVLGEITTTAIPADPPAVPGAVSTYSKMVGPVAHLFAEDSAGVVYPLTPPAAGGVVGLAGTAYVSKAGNDGTAVVGNMALPFLTIQAALNATVSGDAVLIGPGIYVEDVLIPDRSDLSIIGSGLGVTTIQSTGLGVALTYAAGAPGDRSLFVTEITLDGGAFEGLVLSGGAESDLAFVGFFFDSVNFISAGIPFSMKRVNKVVFRDCISMSAVFSQPILNEVGEVLFYSCDLTSGLDVGYDDANPTPISGRVTVSLFDCFVGSRAPIAGPLVLRGHPKVTTDRATQITRGVVDAGLSYNAGNTLAPVLICPALIGDSTVSAAGSVILNLPAIPAVVFAPLMQIDFTRAIFYGSAAGVQFTIGGLIPYTILARHAVFNQIGVGAISVGNLLNLDARDSSFELQAAFAVVGSGTLDRSKWVVLGVPNPGGVFIIPFLPFPNAVYDARITVALAPIAVATSIVAKLPGSVQVVTAIAAGTVDLLITRSP